MIGFILGGRPKPRVPSGPEGILVTFSGKCVMVKPLLFLDRQKLFCSEIEEHKDSLLTPGSKPESRLQVDSLRKNGPQSTEPRRLGL